MSDKNNDTRDNNANKVQIWVKKDNLEYEAELRRLQVELLKFQNHVKEEGLRVLMLFEGRDARGQRRHYQAHYRTFKSAWRESRGAGEAI